ncbi:MAG: S-methyl-5-thioribose-1-phosphate isomerase [Gammaproteobacteria bacterium]|nr:S-methyl-5-thioribose-1-phosphate isomerase [Gammaproteobacteria bacterium]
MSLPTDSIRAIRWEADHLTLLDQRVLPLSESYRQYHDAPGVADAIRQMVVRGAPAIGITAAYGVVLAARQHFANTSKTWRESLAADIKLLAQSRPTAVNLFWALERMQRVLNENTDTSVLDALLHEALAIHDEDIAANFSMGEYGAGLISGQGSVLTHCNTGSLATGGYGTALGVIRSAYRQEKITEVFADETRPWLQGARLTAWELVKDKIPVRLLAEGAAASLMRSERPGWVIVGADRIAANGDVANKIGTYSLAVLARQHGVNFMVVAPTSTVDMSIASGEDIPIEYRDEQELLQLGGNRIAAEGAHAWNPVFDVTPAGLIDAIVTERGVILQPDNDRLLKHFSE